MSEETTWTEEIEITGSQLVDRVKELVDEGNVRRLIIRTSDDRTLLEIPLTIMDTPLYYRRDDIWPDCANLIDSVEEVGGVLTILWHHAAFNDTEYPGWAGKYKRIIGECLQRGAWVTEAGRISDWWNRRLGLRLQASIEDNKLNVISQEGAWIRVHRPGKKEPENFCLKHGGKATIAL